MFFNYHLLLISFLIILIYFLSSFNIISIIILVVILIIIFYLLFFKKQSYYQYLWLLFLFAISLFSTSTNFKTPKFTNNDNPISLKVVSLNPNYFIVQTTSYNYYLANTYYFHNIKYKIMAQLDDTIICSGYVKPLKTINNFYEFDFKQFLQANNVHHQIIITSKQVQVIPGNTIRQKCFNYIDSFSPPIKNWTKLLLFGQQHDDTKNITKMFMKWGIMPLIIVSGLHINFLLILCKKSLFFISNQTIKICIMFLFLLFYVYLLNWSIAGMRVLIFLFLTSYFKLRKKEIAPLTVLSLTTYCCLIINPLQIYLLGFQLSFGISFLILFMINKFKDYGWYIKLLLINIICYLFTIPFQWQINHGFSLLTIPYSLLFMPIIIFYNLMLLINIFLNPLTNIVVRPLLNLLITIITNMNIMNIWIPTFQINIWVLQLYYGFLIGAYHSWKYFNWKLLTIIAFNCSFIAILWCCNIIKPFYELTMINVGNAMSILVSSPYNRSAILIDAGTQDLKPNNPTIYRYLSAKGIGHLNAIFLTHNHLDHTSNVSYLKKNLTIDNIYDNKKPMAKYHFSNFNPIINLSYGLNIDNASENNKSLVLLLQIYQYKILFTGDIEAVTEKLLINANILPKITILQVAHHGSKTSSTLPFLQITKPEIALIAAQYQKHKPFPSSQTLHNLKKINAKVYYSQQNKTVIIRIYPQHYDIITLT